MSVEHCNCINRQTIIAQTIGKIIHKQLRCIDCGRMFIEQEEMIEFGFPDNFSHEHDIIIDNLKNPHNLIFEGKKKTMGKKKKGGRCGK